MQECKHKASLCDCIDWKSDDLTLRINHLISNFEFIGFEFEYTSLEAAEERRLCKVGQCRTCEKRLCFAQELPTQDTVDGLLAKIYRWMYQLWRGPGEKLPKGISNFREMFLRLFHEDDQELVREWLSRPENQNVHQMYRNSGEEVW